MSEDKQHIPYLILSIDSGDKVISEEEEVRDSYFIYFVIFSFKENCLPFSSEFFCYYDYCYPHIRIQCIICFES